MTRRSLSMAAVFRIEEKGRRSSEGEALGRPQRVPKTNAVAPFYDTLVRSSVWQTR
jgi:hypothetical protein